MILRCFQVLVLVIFTSMTCMAASPPASTTGGAPEGGKNPAGSEMKKNEDMESCVATAKGPIASTSAPQQGSAQINPPVSGAMTQARVGKPAPDFEANAFQNGKFKNIKLSDYKGRWVALCFYPGDFTFV
jgi:hypothetical protein